MSEMTRELRELRELQREAKAFVSRLTRERDQRYAPSLCECAPSTEGGFIPEGNCPWCRFRKVVGPLDGA